MTEKEAKKKYTLALSKLTPEKRHEHLHSQWWHRILLCPCCMEELVVTGQKRLRTLDEHVSGSDYVSLKDAFQCLNPICKASEEEIVWNRDGELYSGKNGFHGTRTVPFIRDNDAPFGSFQRASNVSIYYKGVKKKIFSYRIGKKKYNYIWKYEADYGGFITKRRITSDVWRKDGEHWVGHLSFRRMFMYKVRDSRRLARGLKRTWKEAKKDPETLSSKPSYVETEFVELIRESRATIGLRKDDNHISAVLKQMSASIIIQMLFHLIPFEEIHASTGFFRRREKNDSWRFWSSLYIVFRWQRRMKKVIELESIRKFRNRGESVGNTVGII